MDQSKERRTRLAQLLDLAQTYNGWTRKDLAKALRRDPTKLIPGSGTPKLDFVVDLSNILDWSVDQVVSHLFVENGVADDAPVPESFDAIDDDARHAHRHGEYRQLIELARQSLEIASTPEERARAHNREAGGWDGLGRYTNVLTAVQNGLRQTPVSAEFRRVLQSNLANTYYSLWSLIEAKSISADLLSWYADHPPETMRDRKTLAFAHYVAGHTSRRLLYAEPDLLPGIALGARADLLAGRDQYLELADELGDDSFAGIANTCEGGIVEVEVALDRREPVDALEVLTKGLDDVSDSSRMPIGDRLESYGWWCIFGCNIALRHLSDERRLQQYMAVFTNKADEIAERLDNWAIRERVFTMEHSRWERAVGCTGFDIPRIVDEDDVRIIAGTMARFPTFRDTGWEILRSARVVRTN